MPTADNEGRVTKLLDLLAHTPIDQDAMAVVRDLLYEDAMSSSRPTAGELEATKLLAKGKSKSNERPTTAELETWMGAGECPDVAKDEALALLAELLGLELRGPLRIVNGESLACRKAYPQRYGPTRPGDIPPWPNDGFRPKHVKIVDVAKMWDQSGKHQGTFPLGPLIRAWQQRGTGAVVEADRRRYGIVPKAALVAPSAPRKSRRPAKPRQGVLMDVTQVAKKHQTAHLPGLAPAPTPNPPPLHLFDLAGGRTAAQKSTSNGVSLELRIWLEAIMSVPVPERGHARVTVQLHDIAGPRGWLWPNGWQLRHGDGEALVEALRWVDQMTIPTTRVGIDGTARLWNVRPVVLRATHWGESIANYEGAVEFDIRLPGGPEAGRGPMVDRLQLRDYGAHRARAYRLYISLAYHWNEHGTWQGKRLRPSQPAALKYGLLRVFTPDDIAKMCYSPQTLEAMTKPSYRKYRHRAVEELQQMADEGALVLERGRTPEGADGYIILPPEGFGIPMPMPSMPMLEGG